MPDKRNNNQKNIAGFTFVELMVTIGIFALLASFITVNLIRTQQRPNLDATITSLVSDLKEQQIKSMGGDSEGQAVAQTYGVYFASGSYTLFRGSTFQPSDQSNFTVNPDSVQFSTSLPSSQLVFSRRSGEVTGFVNGSNTITIKNTVTNDQKIITIHRYGAITIN